jgi:hypothetical protein
MKETWKPIKKYEGLYEVSNLGNVRSLPRNTTKGRILKIGIRRGYAKVTLYKDGVSCQCSVHRLVAESFIPNPLRKPMVNHIDENRLNNSVANLEWCTHIENCIHGTANERMRKAQINRHDLSRAVKQFEKNGDFVCEFESIREAERETQILHSSIVKCLKGIYGTAGGFIWKYASQKTRPLAQKS